MRILVSGMGRGGTCLLSAVVEGLGIVEFIAGVQSIEDRRFFKYNELPFSYGTKLAIDHLSFTIDSITTSMKRHADLYIVFSIRHPLDVFMSKIRRVLSDDGKPDVAIARIEKFHLIYKAMVKRYPNRVLTVKMEELVLHSDQEVRRVAKFFRVVPTQQALEFCEYDRNRFHQTRYKGRLDSSRVGIHKRWKTVDNGFFKDREADILTATAHLYKIIKDWGYEVG